jgi:hypothetical protein
MKKFVMVSRVFWIKNGLHNRFLGQKSIDPDFPTTTVTGI